MLLTQHKPKPYVSNWLLTRAGQVAAVKADWEWPDYWGAAAVRLGIGRDRYTVEPGLYAMGDPGPDSPVLATANYKLTFDHLRRAIRGRDAWILVLDTKGINVWCAAGKGNVRHKRVGAPDTTGRRGQGRFTPHRDRSPTRSRRRGGP